MLQPLLQHQTIEIFLKDLAATEKAVILSNVKPLEVVIRLFLTIYPNPGGTIWDVLHVTLYQMVLVTKTFVYILDLEVEKPLQNQHILSCHKISRSLVSGISCAGNKGFIDAVFLDQNFNKLARFVSINCNTAHTIKDVVINP